MPTTLAITLPHLPNGLLIAEAGDAIAQYNLGLMHKNGWGVPQDYAEAVKLYRLAAEVGDVNAQYNLGVMYANRWGVPQDYSFAYMWINLAAAQGDELAQMNRDTMANDTTSEQLAEAQKMSRRCLAQNYKNC